ncbi:MAG: hypothetical protein IJ990_00175 [Alistipes sp.]|nr:hypothetical protein [Alistipes sp.]
MAQNGTITPHFKNNRLITDAIVHSLSIKKRGQQFLFCKIHTIFESCIFAHFSATRAAASIEQHDAATQQTKIQKT